MGRFRGVSNISVPKYAKKKMKREKRNLSCLLLNAYPNFSIIVLHLEIAIVGVLALRIAVRMALGIIN